MLIVSWTPGFFKGIFLHAYMFYFQGCGDLKTVIMERNGVRKGLFGPSEKSVEKISMCHLDSIDKEGPGVGNEEADVDRDRVVDHSSEDSGTECRHASMMRSREDAFLAQSPASSLGESSLDHQHQLMWEHKGNQLDETNGHFIDITTGAVIGPVASLPESSRKTDEYECEEDVSGLKPGSSFFEDEDESASNDRDSGHGGEAKSQQNGATNIMCDSGHAEWMSDVDTPHAFIPGDSHSVHCLSSSPPWAASALSQSSQQQLPHSSSRSITPLNAINHPQHISNQSRPHMRNLRQRHTELPLPPPPPSPPTQINLPTTTATAASVELASETISIRDEVTGKVHSQSNGSNDLGQSQEKPDIGFSPPRPPPSPPNIA